MSSYVKIAKYVNIRSCSFPYPLFYLSFCLLCLHVSYCVLFVCFYVCLICMFECLFISVLFLPLLLLWDFSQSKISKEELKQKIEDQRRVLKDLYDEAKALITKKKFDAKCITEIERFNTICLEENVSHISLMSIHDTLRKGFKGPLPDPPPHK